MFLGKPDQRIDQHVAVVAEPRHEAAIELDGVETERRQRRFGNAAAQRDHDTGLAQPVDGAVDYSGVTVEDAVCDFKLKPAWR